MAITIFYSWQSDLPKNTNQNFIEDALEEAIKIVGKEFEIQEALRDENLEIDRDTKGVPGMPPIVDTIFDKISLCGIFVPDLSFVGKTESNRLVPNPNVLVEYGYALKSITNNRIIAVMNSAFGEPTNVNMPFDIRHLRFPITYNLKENVQDIEKIKVKEKLANELAIAIKAVLNSKVLNSQSNSSNIFDEIKATTNPSTFLQLNEELFTRGEDEKIFLPNVERLFLRIIPTKTIEPIKTSKEAEDFIRAGYLQPMTREFSGVDYKRNKHGSISINYARDNKISNFTQLFKNKEIWGIDNDLIDKNKIKNISGFDFGYFPCVAFENVFKIALSNYMGFASKTLKLELPLRFIAGATSVKNYKMGVASGGFNPCQGRVVDENIVYEGKIDDYNKTPIQILRPFFNYVWEECGLERPDKESLD